MDGDQRSPRADFGYAGKSRLRPGLAAGNDLGDLADIILPAKLRDLTQLFQRCDDHDLTDSLALLKRAERPGKNGNLPQLCQDLVIAHPDRASRREDNSRTGRSLFTSGKDTADSFDGIQLVAHEQHPLPFLSPLADASDRSCACRQAFPPGA